MNEQEKKDITKLFSKIEAGDIKSILPNTLPIAMASQNVILYFTELRKRTEKEFESDLIACIASILLNVSRDIDESLTISRKIQKALEMIDRDINKI